MAERAARKGAIFDMDGVLVDNVDHHVQAWKLFAREHGRDLTDQAIRATFGQRNREMMEALLGESFSDLQLIQPRHPQGVPVSRADETGFEGLGSARPLPFSL